MENETRESRKHRYPIAGLVLPPKLYSRRDGKQVPQCIFSETVQL